jgi:hypothetical protein
MISEHAKLDTKDLELVGLGKPCLPEERTVLPEGYTVQAGLAQIALCGTLVLPARDYPEKLTINQPVRLESQGGPARIGVRP